MEKLASDEPSVAVMRHIRHIRWDELRGGATTKTDVGMGLYFTLLVKE